MQTSLSTERLLLGSPTMADLDSLVELDSDPEVMKYLTGGRPTSPKVMEEDQWDAHPIEA